MNPVFKALSGPVMRGNGREFSQFIAAQLSQKPYGTPNAPQEIHLTPEEQLMQVQKPHTNPPAEEDAVLEEGCHDSDLRTCIPEAQTAAPSVATQTKSVQKSFLSGPMTMQKAIIASEILDKPLALRRKR